MLRLLPALLAVPAAYASPFDAGIPRALSARQSSNGTEPCAQVAQLIAQQAGLGGANIDPTLALQCLRSVPLDTDGNKAQLLGVKTLSQFQSTLAFLENPIEGYLYPAVDIFGGLEELSAKLDDGAYDNEYDFQLDLLKLINSAYDQHYDYAPDITQVFSFGRDTLLFSLSEDGVSLPELYTSVDVRALASGNVTDYVISPLTKINGELAEEFLRKYADLNSKTQDPDASYNAMIGNIPYSSIAGDLSNAWAKGTYFADNETVYEFKNGSNRRAQDYASTYNDFSGIVDGLTFFRKFCTGFPPTSLSTNATSSTNTNVSISASVSVPSTVPTTPVPFSAVPQQTVFPAADYYPDPWVISDDRQIACYFPEDQEDTAVLSVPSFDPTGLGAENQFSNVVRQCLATSKELGKKRLIVDLRGNPGGIVFMAFDMFKQLFPSMTPYGGTNFRASSLFNDVGQILTEEYENVSFSNRTSADYDNGYTSIFNANDGLDAQLDDYDSWQEFYGPVEVNGGEFTNILRYNLSDPYDTGKSQVSGFGNLTNITPEQVFAAEDIVLLQDGACASTCAVFAEFMKSQGQVKTIVMGGRSQIGPMQGVGGVKGANVYPAVVILDSTQEAFALASPEKLEELNEKYAVDIENFPQSIQRVAKTSDGTLLARVNIRNNIRQGDDSLTPLQFVYEAADCRLFYTASMILDQSLVWKAAYDAQWNGAQCVEGSTGQVSSGFGTDYINGGTGNSSEAEPGSEDGEPGEGAPTQTNSATLLKGSVVLTGVVAAIMALL